MRIPVVCLPQPLASLVAHGETRLVVRPEAPSPSPLPELLVGVAAGDGRSLRSREFLARSWRRPAVRAALERQGYSSPSTLPRRRVLAVCLVVKVWTVAADGILQLRYREGATDHMHMRPAGPDAALQPFPLASRAWEVAGVVRFPVALGYFGAHASYQACVFDGLEDLVRRSSAAEIRQPRDGQGEQRS